MNDLFAEMHSLKYNHQHYKFMKKKLLTDTCYKHGIQRLLRTMKITVFLLFIGFLQLSAATYSQNTKLDLSLNEVTLREVFEAIEKQSDLRFLFRDNIIDSKQHVTINMKGTVDQILKELTKDNNIEYQVLSNNLIVISNATSSEIVTQQQKSISGKVTDSSGGALPGVTVVVKGTTTGTITDAEGNYSMSNVSSDATLLFSFVGMKTQEVKLAGKSKVDVIMLEETIGIEEVVAIGYGTMKKSDLTGSVVSANIKAFRESPNVSIVQSLQGSVSGLNIGQVTSSGQNPSISIRGLNTFESGNSTPLIVVDGIIYKGNLVDLNPSDIESVDILKDASSTAIYGSRAANGVILITTKRGKSGTPEFNYTSSYSFETPAKTLRLLDRNGFIQKTSDALWQSAYLAPDYTKPNPSFDPTLQWNSTLNQGYADGTDFNWWDAATQTGHIQNHDLSMSGKNDRTTYFISAGYTDQLGYIVNDNYKRYSGRINFENKIRDWLKVGVQTFVTSSNFSGISPNLSDILRESPLVTPYDENGKLVPYPDGQAVFNPFFNSENTELNKQLNLFGNFYTVIDVPFIKGLTYRINYSQNYRSTRQYQFNPYGSSFLGSAVKLNGNSHDWTFDNIISYSRTIQKHKIDMTFVYGREESEYESSTLSANTFSNMDLGYNNMGVAQNQFTSSSAWKESSLYFMGRANYTFNEKYLATFTIRRDGFSGFSENHKFGTFPSAAIGWVISKENFMENKPLSIDFLKIRASYGVNGNRTLGRYSTLARVTASPRYIFGDGKPVSLGQSVTSLANGDLNWETTTGLNLGLDYTLWNDRIRGTIEYYNNNTRDILYNINIPTITGYSSITANVGKVHNQGLEFTINSTTVKTKDFTWDMGINFSRNRNQVRSIIGLDNNDDGKEDDLVSNSLFIGKPLNSIYTYVIQGLYQIGDNMPAGYKPGQYKIKDLNNDELYTADFDRQIIGYGDPSYRFGITNAFQYKNWSLRVFINSVQGGKKYYYGQNEPGVDFYYTDHAVKSNRMEYDYWTPSNPNAEYPQLYYPSPNNARAYRQRSFVRLQDVALSYEFDNGLIKKIGCQNLKIYLSGKNLYTWTKWKGWDPETGYGLTRFGRPVLKSYTMGINLTF
jgi:TonB-linked SusC/RagA family outer membrane protein